jgi:DNA repair exonuclease SbcCD nuclease subunit
MKYLVVGDVHIKLDNLQDIQLFIKKLQHEIIERQPSFIVLLGDILHTHERIHTSCLQYAEELFSMCAEQCPTYVLVGNHDYISNSQFLTSQHWMTPFAKWKNIHIVDRVVPFTIEGYRFVACPYVPDGRMVEALNTVTDWQKAHMIFGHQTLNGVKMGAVVAEQVEDWLAEYPFLCSGHIHDKQRVQPNLYYTGTPMQQAFGESHHKTIVQFTWTDQDLVQEEIALKVAVKRIVYITVQQAYSYQLQVEPYEMVRLTIKGSKEECNIFKKTPAYKNLSLLAKIVFDEITTDKNTEELQSTFHEVLYKNIQSNFFLTKLYKEYAALPHSTDVQFM